MMRVLGSLTMVALLVSGALAAEKGNERKQRIKPGARDKTPVVKVAASPMKRVGAGKLLTAGRLKLEPAAPTKTGRMKLGKDEANDLLPEMQPDYAKWRNQVSKVMKVGGKSYNVAYVEVGPPDAAKPTLIHFHGATVQPENVLLYRMARAFEALGVPIRIIAPSSYEYDAADDIVKEAGRLYGKVAVSGHSAGAGPTQSVASRHPDIVSNAFFFDSPASPSKTPTIWFNGHASTRSSGKNVLSLNLTGVDHSMRSSPYQTSTHYQKGFRNATPDSANVIKGVASIMLEAITGQPVGGKSMLAELKGKDTATLDLRGPNPTPMSKKEQDDRGGWN